MKHSLIQENKNRNNLQSFNKINVKKMNKSKSKKTSHITDEVCGPLGLYNLQCSGCDPGGASQVIQVRPIYSLLTEQSKDYTLPLGFFSLIYDTEGETFTCLNLTFDSLWEE